MSWLVTSLCVCSKRQQIGMAVGVSLGCIVLLGVIAVPVVYMRRQWARAEENKLRLTARMSGLDESEVRSEVGTRHQSACAIAAAAAAAAAGLMVVMAGIIGVSSHLYCLTVSVLFQPDVVHLLTAVQGVGLSFITVNQSC